MVNFDTQYTNINHLSNNMNNKKVVSKNEDTYFNSVIKNLISLKKPKKNKGIMDLLM